MTADKKGHHLSSAKSRQVLGSVLYSEREENDCLSQLFQKLCQGIDSSWGSGDVVQISTTDIGCREQGNTGRGLKPDMK